MKHQELSYFTNFYKPQAFLISLDFQKYGTKKAKFDKIWPHLYQIIRNQAEKVSYSIYY